MNSEIPSSSIGSELTNGKSKEDKNKKTNITEALEKSFLFLSKILATSCLNIIKWVKIFILMSMEHRSYINHKYLSKVIYSIIFTSIIIISNSNIISAVDASSLAPRIVEISDHDPNAFTQGLEIIDGKLFESTGLYGFSSLREVNISSGEIIRQISFEDDIFAEGITALNNSIVMLTWKENVALIIDIDTFEIIGNYTYSGEGWGLCNNGNSFVMSNGSSELAFRSFENFDLMSSLIVREGNHPISNINELECVGDSVFANVWGEDRIIKINMSSGLVEMSIHFDSIEFIQNNSNSILNGIAYSVTEDAFWITGKNWEKMYLTQFEIENYSYIENTGNDFFSSPIDKVISILILLIITIFIMPGSWPALTFMFFRIFKRQTEHLSPPRDINTVGEPK